jgi:hypothetical protein
MIPFLEDLQYHRNALVREIDLAPEQILPNLYQFRGRQVGSPYISINTPWLCCFLQSCPSSPGPNPWIRQITLGNLPFWLKRRDDMSLQVEYRTQLRPNADKFSDGCGMSIPPNLVMVGTDAFTNELLISYFLDYFYTPSTIIPVVLTLAASLCHPLEEPSVPDPEAYVEEDVPGPLYSSGEEGLGSLLGGSTAFLGQTPRTLSFYRTSRLSGITGLFLQEAPDLGRLSNLPYSTDLAHHRVETQVHEYNGDVSIYDLIRPETVRQIMAQLLVALFRLQTYLQFQHGQLTVEDIWLSRDAVNVDIYGIPLVLDFTCKLSNLSAASLTQYLGPTHQPHRFYQRVPQLDRVNLPQPELTPIIGEYNGESYYLLPSSLSQAVIDRWRYLGYPFYSTFDTYTLIISLLLIPQFLYSIMTNASLRRTLWDPLWFPVDDNVMYYRILDQMGQRGNQSTWDNRGEAAPGFADIVDLLRNVRLKCQVTRDLLRALGGTL